MTAEHRNQGTHKYINWSSVCLHRSLLTCLTSSSAWPICNPSKSNCICDKINRQIGFISGMSQKHRVQISNASQERRAVSLWFIRRWWLSHKPCAGQALHWSCFPSCPFALLHVIAVIIVTLIADVCRSEDEDMVIPVDVSDAWSGTGQAAVR